MLRNVVNCHLPVGVVVVWFYMQYSITRPLIAMHLVMSEIENLIKWWIVRFWPSQTLMQVFSIVSKTHIMHRIVNLYSYFYILT